MYLLFNAMYQLFTDDCIHKHILYRPQTKIIYIEACHDKAAMTTTNMDPYLLWIKLYTSKLLGPKNPKCKIPKSKTTQIQNYGISLSTAWLVSTTWWSWRSVWVRKLKYLAKALDSYIIYQNKSAKGLIKSVFHSSLLSILYLITHQSLELEMFFLCPHFFSCSLNLIPTKTLCDTVILWQAAVCEAAKFRFYQEPFDKRIHKSKCVCIGKSKVYSGSSHAPNFIPLNLIFSTLKKYIVLIFCRVGYQGHFSHKLRSWTDCLVSTAQGK